MRRVFFILLVGVCLIAPTVAQNQDEIADLSGKAAKISRAANAGRLTGPSSSGRPEIVSAFLRGNHGHNAATADSVVLETENPTAGGPIHIRLGQRIDGFDVYGTYAKATLTPEGELLSVVENLAVVGGPLLPAQVDYPDALSAVLQRRYPGQPSVLPEVASTQNKVTFARGARFHQDPTVTRVVVPVKGGHLRVGYLVETWDQDNQLWHTVVGGNGRILFEELRTASDTYNVFRNHPNITPQAVVSGPGAGNVESPSGWVTSNTTIGNNVDAYLDAVNDNIPDLNSRPVSATRDFLTAADLSQAPSTSANRAVAIANLFYLNNVLHDKLYKHGFNEAAGNFQTNNFNKGGFGNDPVNAEAQDGGGTNNANFATPGDGSRPRMQMYLWTTATPNRDGDLDSDIVYHEYGHGLTWRMIGGMSGPFAGAIGEGMSDTLAIYINNNDRVAEYSRNNSLGLRRYTYTNYPLSYADITGGSVHSDGEIYAATMWKLRDLWLAAGLTEDELWNHVIDGMNWTPSRPAYEDMRDGILASANTAAEDCLVWQAFAHYGIGVGANGTETPFAVTESFTVPASCTAPPTNTAPTATITAPADGSSFQQNTPVTFTGTANDAEQGNLTANLVWTSNTQGNIGSGGSFTYSNLAVGTHIITATVTDNGGLQGSAVRTITITAGPNTAPTVTITAPTAGASFQQNTPVTFTGTASDAEQDNLPALVWTSNTQGTIGTGDSFTRSDLTVGTHIITAAVTDKGGLTGTATRTITITGTPPTNTAPTATITAPADGGSFQQDTPVTFAGTASDAEQGDLTASLVWTSNTQGTIGSGGTFTRSNLTLGTHIITATVTDSGGLQGTATRTIMITSVPPPGTIALSTTGYKVKGVRRADLNWTGATTSVDVYRDNVKVSANPVPGSSYTDVIGGKGQGTFIYKVCHAGTTTCSNTSMVVFYRNSERRTQNTEG